ncbi:hypothetical protein TEQG_07063 [Trichophyton equinum CBS 127.97]|uniref:Uncharacterized protein n=1 Tax=Trichophyton equinum (strain ATCC MYA-4606 / CBS 127.97) TaxID=559882 RepID=F2Q1S0_TRIEC|nr:hypothetical protein TEQG_07063 [Trichophyton equinum CBS 127.97]
MGGATGVIKTLFIPALISLVLYLTISFVIAPFIRLHRQRYSQYLPLHTISVHTTSLRDRTFDALMNITLPSSWRHRSLAHEQVSDSLFDDDGEDGYELSESRREALDQERREARLARELEDGFIPDSDGEDTPGTRRI